MVTSDLSGYSYDALLEAYFDVDRYSAALKQKLDRYEMLLAKGDAISEEEFEERFELRRELSEMPTFRADELAIRLNQLRFKYELT